VSPLLSDLIEALRCLPGVGPKSAQRMAFFLLQKNPQAARRLSHTVTEALDKIKQCQDCRTLTEYDRCQLCSNNKRNHQLLCIVENPMDILSLEQAACYDGLYFVLHGHLSPIDGIGPNQLGLEQLQDRLAQNTIQELVLALNATVESQTTKHYITAMVQNKAIKIASLAHGIPLGSELGYSDQNTIAHAFHTRQELAE
jgi:recombination protein RecR